MVSSDPIETVRNTAHFHPLAIGVSWVFALSALGLFAGGLYTGSLALIGVAALNVFELVFVIMQLIARRVAGRQADEHIFLGYGRMEISIEFTGFAMSIILTAVLIYQSVLHLIAPQQTYGWMVVALLSLTFLVEAVVFLKVKSQRKSAALRPPTLARLGLMAAVSVGGAAMVANSSAIGDPILAILVASFVLWHATRGFAASLRLSLIGTHSDFDTSAVVREIMSVEGVEDVHHLHFWRLTEDRLAVDAHVVVTTSDWQNAEAIRDRVEATLFLKCGIEHSTLEVETPNRELDECHAYGR